VTSSEVEEIKGHFDKVAQELRGEVTGLRGEVTGLRGEVTGLRGEMSGLRGEVADLRGEMTAEFAAVRGEMTSEFTAVRGEMAAEFTKVRGDLSELRRDSAEVADHLMEKVADARHEAGAQAEELRTLIQTVAEGVTLANERLDALTAEVRSGFAEAPRRTPPPRRH